MDYKPFQPQRIVAVEGIVTVHYFEFARGYVFAGEAHDFWEFVYMDKGEAEIGADDRRFVLERGQGVFHQPGEFHSIWASAGNPPDIAVISFVCHSPVIEHFRNRRVTVGEEEKLLIAQVIREARDAWSNDPASNYLELAANPAAAVGAQQWVCLSLELLLLRFLRQDAAPSAQEPALRHRLRNEPRSAEYKKMLFRDIETWVCGHLEEKITIGTLAARFNLSQTSLKQLFREEAGAGVNKQLSAWRHAAAKRMIRDGRVMMKAIAESCGYVSVHYFSRRFAQMEGMTPTEYARSVKSKSAG